MSVWGDIANMVNGANDVTNPAAGVTSAGLSAAGGVANAASGAGGIADALSAFFAAVTDVYMWRSLGWLALGIVLLFAGAALWLKKEGALPSVIPLPVPV
jgi:uncharacterized membrane protein YedE/YeeE